MRHLRSRAPLPDPLGARHGSVTPLPHHDCAPAERFRLRDGTVFGIIASTTAPFCRTCDRARLTADGTLLLCLYGERGLDLRELLRLGVPDAEIADRIRATWSSRDDRGAEARAALPDRGVLHQIESLRADPRREMHTRGG
jgi:cyclic pyranopterin phosphate synthase